MNKYQEALSDMVDNGVTVDYFNEKAKLPQSENPLFTIQELVDRATPKKPPKHDKVVCPTCNSKANYGHPYTEYCCHCGQAIDWSKTENE